MKRNLPLGFQASIKIWILILALALILWSRTLNSGNLLFISKMKVKQKSSIEAFCWQSRIRNSTILDALLTVIYLFLPISESILVIYCCITSNLKFSCLSDTFNISKVLFIKHSDTALFDALLYGLSQGCK